MSDFYQLNAEQQANRLELLAKSALRHWNAEHCEPELIKYRENAVFKVADAAGAPAVLRVHRQGYHSNDSLASELRWMAMLRESGMHVPSPIAVTNSDGNGDYLINATSDQTPGHWQVDMPVSYTHLTLPTICSV